MVDYGERHIRINLLPHHSREIFPASSRQFSAENSPGNIVHVDYRCASACYLTVQQQSSFQIVDAQLCRRSDSGLRLRMRNVNNERGAATDQFH